MDEMRGFLGAALLMVSVGTIMVVGALIEDAIKRRRSKR